MLNKGFLNTPIGWLSIEDDGNVLTRIKFEDFCDDDCGRKSELTKITMRQLEEYFSGQRFCFSLPLAHRGTQFMKAVWQALTTIPYGEVRSYGYIAKQIGNPNACRAVGMANHNNPLPIIIPCHRVIGTGGKLTGYAGGLTIKKKLLELENLNKR